jgi:hypothetical protein
LRRVQLGDSARRVARNSFLCPVSGPVFLDAFIFIKEFMMSLIADLMEKPTNLPVASRYAVANGFLYLASGVLTLAWPGVVQTLFRDPAFAGHEEALFRLIGMLVAVIGLFILFGGRSGARQTVAVSVVSRLTLAPLVLAALAWNGVFPHALASFAVLDPVLGIGAWISLRRARS